MNLTDKTSLRGEFHLKVYRKGALIETYRDKNLIVDAGFGLVQQLLSSAADDKHISRVAFGELLTADPEQPEADWTDIPNVIEVTSGVEYKAFTTVTFPTARSVSFNWELTGSEANGNDISYFGLKNSEDTLFAAKSRPAIAKSEDITIEGTWIIHY